MGLCEFLFRQVTHEHIQYFLFKMRNCQFLSQAKKDMQSDGAAKLLKKIKHPLQPNMFWFFALEKFFDQEEMLNLNSNCCVALSVNL